MRKTLFVLVGVVALAVLGLTYKGSSVIPSYVVKADAERSCLDMKFADYPALDTTPSEISAIDWTQPSGAQSLRSVVDPIYTGSIDFAGKYSVIEHSCGSGGDCLAYTSVDTSDGHLLMLGVAAKYGIDYRSDSRLLVLNPPKNLPDVLPKDVSTKYFVLENDPNLDEDILSPICTIKYNQLK